VPSRNLNTTTAITTTTKTPTKKITFHSEDEKKDQYCTGINATTATKSTTVKTKLFQQRIVRDDGKLVSVFHTGHGRRKREYALAGDSTFFGKYKYFPKRYQFVLVNNKDSRYISEYFSERDIVYIPSSAETASATATPTTTIIT
jgi:hypothetical protein